ncbi:MAG: hypothetical protein R3B84_21450 [Zavarzinella sp.]
MTMPTPPSDSDTARELANQQSEPLLPVEKWLIGGSLALGLVLLVLLLWVSRTYFPAGQ